MGILIVDDDKLFLETVQTGLGDSGYEIECASSSKEALKKMDATDFWLVMTDLKMPGIDGLGLLERVKERNKDTQVILFTGHATVETAVQALRSGAYDYLTKPFKIESIVSKIEEAKEDWELNRKMGEFGSDQAHTETDFLAGICTSTTLMIMPESDFSNHRDQIDEIRSKGTSIAVVRLDLAAEEDTMSPKKLNNLTERIRQFFEEHPESQLLFFNIDYLIEAHSPDHIVKYVAFLNEKIVPEGSGLFITTNSTHLTPSAYQELSHLLTRDRISEFASIIAHPLRLDLLNLLTNTPHMNFNSIKADLDIENSSTLAFHLRTLSSTGIVAKDGDGRYNLTTKGQKLVDLMKAGAEWEEGPSGGTILSLKG